MSHLRPITRDVDFLLPPSVPDWLPDGHLARYVVEVVEGLDLSALEWACAGRGSLPYHPALLLSLLIYGYATSCYTSPKIERATDDSLPFRFIAANQHPDNDTLSTFRRRFAKEFEDIYGLPRVARKILPQRLWGNQPLHSLSVRVGVGISLSCSWISLELGPHPSTPRARTFSWCW